MQVWFDGMPDSVRAEIDSYGLVFEEHGKPVQGLNAAHIFVKERALLEQHLTALRTMIDPAGQVWVSWPKKASKVETDITEDTIRSVCLPMGFVDIKVCAVDAIWSGLKLTIRKELR
ncbi:hypothetical protein GCM10009096_06360 [Parasphingorhabdus litoris]|uniref:DUF3052 family protein n=2 Tax=Parasphingorhabdus litoris TaxID=394733 RepID=A0ABN1A5R9_9SPHN